MDQFLKKTLRKLSNFLPTNIKKFIYEAYLLVLAIKIKCYLSFAQRDIKSVIIVGMFSTVHSHNKVARLLEKELEGSGFQVTKLDISLFINSPITSQSIDVFEPDKNAEAMIFVVNPDNIINVMDKIDPNLMANKKIIGYWAWELPTPPRKWKKAEIVVDEIWAPSKFSADAFKTLYKKPVRIVPHAVSLENITRPSTKLKCMNREEMHISKECFCVVQSFSISSGLERKNAIGAIKAFTLAFAPDDDAKLILRYFCNEEKSDARNRLRNAACIRPNQIILLEAKDSLEELEMLYSIADTYISLHRSEGFGLNLAEAMHRGLPVIATDWSGNTDFMNSDCSILIPAIEIPIIDLDGIYKVNSKWAEPIYNEAARALVLLKASRKTRKSISIKAESQIKSSLVGNCARKALNQPGKLPEKNEIL